MEKVLSIFRDKLIFFNGICSILDNVISLMHYNMCNMTTRRDNGFKMAAI
jgi:hypothetical protein